MKVTVVMYHYVRDFKNTRYKEIKGLDVEDFKQQLCYFDKYYEFITIEDLIASLNGKKKIPENSILLTFDDAYQDHYKYVYPILKNMGISGAFYTSSKAIYDHSVLDVNKIHFVLAKAKTELIIESIRQLFEMYKEDFKLKEFDYYYKKLSSDFLYDDRDTMFIKRLLQYELPLDVRKEFLDHLFCRYVGVPENVFSEELYLTLDQVLHMSKNGMHIGSHGHNHYWLNKLTKKEQEAELLLSIEYLSQMSVDLDNWTICYPYGGYNKETIDILQKYNCQLGFADDAIDIADLNTNNRFALPRLDTNDFPCDANALPNHWTKQVIKQTREI
jgi:peptidoglycan/xylan/chitin deacetylase (PgdA/CDA1 family)